jgi:cytoskeletal protein CcmA (bactofilin family)
MNMAYSQTNTLPPNGNVGIGTTSPTSTLQVNGTAQIDSALYVKDSVVINRSARVKDVLRVDKEVIVKGELRAKDDFRVAGTSRLKGDVILQEGDLKIKSLADSTQSGKRLLMVNSNGKVVSEADFLSIVYAQPSLPPCPIDLNGHAQYAPPAWEREVGKMFLLDKECSPNPKLGVGIKPQATVHVLNTLSSTLPLLIEKKMGSGQPNYKLLELTNNGILYTREVKVNAQNWPDYVFEKEYTLQPLAEVERYINEHKHLPNIPSAKEVETDGLNLGEMNKLLLQKVEELTLHLIEQQKRIEALERQTKTK